MLFYLLCTAALIYSGAWWPRNGTDVTIRSTWTLDLASATARRMPKSLTQGLESQSGLSEIECWSIEVWIRRHVGSFYCFMQTHAKLKAELGSY